MPSKRDASLFGLEEDLNASPGGAYETIQQGAAYPFRTRAKIGFAESEANDENLKRQAIRLVRGIPGNEKRPAAELADAFRAKYEELNGSSDLAVMKRKRALRESLAEGVFDPEFKMNDQQREAVAGEQAWHLTRNQAFAKAVKEAATDEDRQALIDYFATGEKRPEGPQLPRKGGAAIEEFNRLQETPQYQAGEYQKQGWMGKAIDALGVMEQNTRLNAMLEQARRETEDVPLDAPVEKVEKFPKITAMLQRANERAEGGLNALESGVSLAELVHAPKLLVAAGKGVAGVAGLLHRGQTAATERLEEGVPSELPMQPRWQGVPLKELVDVPGAGKRILAAGELASERANAELNPERRASDTTRQINEVKDRYWKASLKLAQTEHPAEPSKLYERAKELYDKYLASDPMIQDPAISQLVGEVALDPTNFSGTALEAHPFAYAGGRAVEAGRAARQGLTTLAGKALIEAGKEPTLFQKAALKTNAAVEAVERGFTYFPEARTMERHFGPEVGAELRNERGRADYLAREYDLKARTNISAGLALQEKMSEAEIESAARILHGENAPRTANVDKLVELSNKHLELMTQIQRDHPELIGNKYDETGMLTRAPELESYGFPLLIKKPAELTPDEILAKRSTAFGEPNIRVGAVQSAPSSEERGLTWEQHKARGTWLNPFEQWKAQYNKVFPTMKANIEAAGIGRVLEKHGLAPILERPMVPEAETAVKSGTSEAFRLNKRMNRQGDLVEALKQSVADKEAMHRSLETWLATGEDFEGMTRQFQQSRNNAELMRQGLKTLKAKLAKKGLPLKPRTAARLKNLDTEIKELDYLLKSASEGRDQLKAALKQFSINGKPWVDNLATELRGGKAVQTLSSRLATARKSLKTEQAVLNELAAQAGQVGPRISDLDRIKQGLLKRQAALQKKGLALSPRSAARLKSLDEKLQALKTEPGVMERLGRSVDELARQRKLSMNVGAEQKRLLAETGIAYKPIDKWVAGPNVANEARSTAGDAYRRAYGQPGQFQEGAHLQLVPAPMADHITSLQLTKSADPQLVQDTVKGYTKQLRDVMDWIHKKLYRPGMAAWRTTALLAPLSDFKDMVGTMGMATLNSGLGLGKDASAAFQMAVMAGDLTAKEFLNGARFTTEKGKVYDLGVVYRKMMETGSINQAGQMVNMDVVGGGPLGKLAKAYQDMTFSKLAGIPGTEKFSRAALKGGVDNWMKFSTLLGYLRKDYPLSVALDKAAEMGGNYSRMGAFEKVALRDAFGFYSWPRFALPRIMKAFVQNPNRLANWDRIRTALANRYGRQVPLLIEQYHSYQQGFGFPAGAAFENRDNGNDVFGVGMLEPNPLMQGLQAFPPLAAMWDKSGETSPVGELARSLSPVARFALELATGRDLVTDEKLSRMPGMEDFAGLLGMAEDDKGNWQFHKNLIGSRPDDVFLRNLWNSSSRFSDAALATMAQLNSDGLTNEALELKQRIRWANFWQVFGGQGSMLDSGLPASFTTTVGPAKMAKKSRAAQETGEGLE